jgi:hypothetical protein
VACRLFVDESGHGLTESPYAVLAGICVEDRDLWNLIDAIKKLELATFGLSYSLRKEEFKAKKFLKRKVFRLATQLEPIPPERRRDLSKEILERGDLPSKERLAALSQAKLFFVHSVLDLCAKYHCHVFGSIVDKAAPRPAVGHLRKDYVFLFERFYYFLDDQKSESLGLIVFDELEKTLSKILLDQMAAYFLETAKGRLRSRLIVPQPFFVHSDLTTMVQVADFIAYIMAWGYRYSKKLTAAARSELVPFAKQVKSLSYMTERDFAETPRFRVWSIVPIIDLRGKHDRTGE